MTFTINRGSFMTLSNTDCLQTSAKQTNAKLNNNCSVIICCSDIIKLSVAKIKGGWIKQNPVAKKLHFANFSTSRNEGRP